MCQPVTAVWLLTPAGPHCYLYQPRVMEEFTDCCSWLCYLQSPNIVLTCPCGQSCQVQSCGQYTVATSKHAPFLIGQEVSVTEIAHVHVADVRRDTVPNSRDVRLTGKQCMTTSHQPPVHALRTLFNTLDNKVHCWFYGHPCPFSLASSWLLLPAQ